MAPSTEAAERVSVTRVAARGGRSHSLTIKYEQVKITPQMAIGWLEATERVKTTVRNRGLSQNNVNLFAENMKKGTWETSHQGIALYRYEGNVVILDGQHRLWAVVSADIPVTMMIAWYSGGDLNDAMEIMQTFDRGQKRNLGQVLKITAGVERGSRKVAAARYLLIFLRTGGNTSEKRTRVVTDTEILDAVDRYEEDLNWVSSLKRSGTFLSAPIAAALIYVHSIPQTREAAEKFGRQIAGGEGLMEGDPALSFREWIIKKTPDALLRRPETRMQLMRIAFKALQATSEKKKLSKFVDTMNGFEYFRVLKGKRS